MRPIRALLLTECVLAPWQIYPGNSVPGGLSVGQLLVGVLAATLLFMALLRPDLRWIPTSRPLLILGGFVALCLLATLWSPDPGLAIRTAVKLGGIAVIALGMAALPVKDRRTAIRVLAGSACLLALLIVLFRFIPILEWGYWLTLPGTLTIDPDILAAVRAGTEHVNALSAGKAGAVFSNANGASLFLGVILFLVVAVSGEKSRFATVVGLILAAGVVATGSKAGLGALTFCGLVWLYYLQRRTTTLARVLVFLLGSVGLSAGVAIYIQQLRLDSAAAVALQSRTAIWSASLPVLVEHPLMGLGFGGWERWAAENFRFLGLSEIYPPQNLLLIAWAWVGLPGAVLLAAFLGSLLVSALRPRQQGPFCADSRKDFGGRGRLALFLAFSWFFAQSMFTNAAVTNIRIGTVVGLGIGLLAPVALTRANVTLPAPGTHDD